MSLQLPATSNDLVLDNVVVPSGYANYFLLAYQQMASSGESLQEFLVRQMIYQSVERYAKYIIQADYDNTIASGVKLEECHSDFVVNISNKEKTLLGDYLV